MSSKWHEKELEEVLHTVRGISFPKESRRDELEDGYIACLRTTNVQENVEWGDLFYAPIERVKRDEQYLQSGDILMSTANSLDLLGKVAFVASLPQKATLGTFILCLRAKSINEVSKFYYYQLKGQEFLNQVRRNAKTTTNISNISVTQLKKLKLKAVDSDIQERITQKLDSLFSKIDAGDEGLKEVEKQLEVYRQAVLKKAFNNDNWPRKLIKDIAEEVRYGSSKKTNEDHQGIPVLRMGNYDSFGNTNFVKLKYLPKKHDEFPELLLKDGDMLFNRTNSAELVGKTMVWKVSMLPVASFASYLIRVRFKEGYSPEFYSAYINSLYGKKWIKTVVNQQVGQANVNGTKLKNLEVPVPDHNVQLQIVEEIKKQYSIIDSIEKILKENSKLTKLFRESILKKAFSGELI